MTTPVLFIAEIHVCAEHALQAWEFLLDICDKHHDQE